MRRSSRRSLAVTSAILAAASAARAEVRTYQVGSAGSDGLLYYTSFDTELSQAASTSDRGGNTTASTDTEGSNGVANTQLQALLKFNQIIGPAVTQVPLGSTINSVTLEFTTTNASANGTSMYTMLTPWTEQTTWSSVRSGGGVANNGVTASTTPAVTFTLSSTGLATVSGSGLTSSVQSWANGAANNGWALIGGLLRRRRRQSGSFSTGPAWRLTRSLRPQPT